MKKGVVIGIISFVILLAVVLSFVFHVWTPGYEKACGENFKFKEYCVADYAVESNNYDLCLKLDGEYRVRCLYSIIRETNNIEICDLFPEEMYFSDGYGNSSSKALCFYKNSKQCTKENERFCDRYEEGSEERDACIWACNGLGLYLNESVSSEFYLFNESLCGRLGETRYKDFCYYNGNIWRYVTQEREFCSTNETDCERNFYDNYLKNSSNLLWCENIKNAPLKEDCYYVFVAPEK